MQISPVTQTQRVLTRGSLAASLTAPMFAAMCPGDRDLGSTFIPEAIAQPSLRSSEGDSSESGVETKRHKNL